MLIIYSSSLLIDPLISVHLNDNASEKKEEMTNFINFKPIQVPFNYFFYYVGAKSESADMTFGKTGFFQTLLAYSDKDLWLS